MALTLAVRCLLLVLVILKLSGKSECLTSKVKNGEEEESSLYYKNIDLIPQNKEKELHDKRSSTGDFSPNRIQDNTSYDNGEKRCRNKLCEIFVRHRVIRQIPTGYSSYSQPPTYSQQGQQYQNNIYKPPTNNYENYPNVNNIYPHYSKTTQHRSTYNSTFTQLPNWKNSSYPNPGFNSGSKHTYPPSPRPNYNKFSSNNRYNISQTPNNLYPYNKNPTSAYTPSFDSTAHPNYPNYYPSYNGNTYPNTNPNSAYPRYGQNNTRQTFNYPNNHNAMPNYSFSNVTHNYPHTKNQNPSPYNGFTQRPPLNPNPNYYYPNQRNASLTYPYNLAPNTGMNTTHVNNYNPGQYYPTPNFAPTTPFGANPNITQNKFSSNPNPFYYPSNYNGPQYDPLRQPPGRLSY